MKTDRELMQMVLDALESFESGTNGIYKGEFAEERKALRDRLAHPESVHAIDISQERVDETVKDRHDLTCVCGAVWVGEEMVCSPRKREWVGLTDEEIGLPTEPIQPNEAILFARVIEALLKDKNA